MRIAKIPSEVVCQQVWASLCERMDSETHLVRPEWKGLMRKIGVCRQRIADAVNSLKAEGKIEVVEERVRKGNREWIVFYYRVKILPYGSELQGLDLGCAIERPFMI